MNPRKRKQDKRMDGNGGEGAAAGHGADAPDGSVIDAEIGDLKSELDDLNGKWLRALADLDNYRKRVERDRRRWTEAAREEVIVDLLDVVDNFERAMACDEDEGGSFREGVELILKHLKDVLKKHGVTPIVVTRECEFDPTLHEAVGSVDSPEHESNQIIEETQKGYMLGDRLLRCSKVIVCK